jgi:acyl dehydratase
MSKESALAQTRQGRIPLRQISAIETQRFAVATGDENRLYFDDEYARSHGLKGIIAHQLT